MPNILDIRRRIRSVNNTQQITKAMKMVSAAKLRRAQERVMSARPYAQKILSVLNSLVTRSEGQTHPLLEDRGGERIQVVVITADKGLCGAFNSNIIRAAQNFVREHRQAETDCHQDVTDAHRLGPPSSGRAPLSSRLYRPRQ